MTIRQWNDHPIVPPYHIEECWICRFVSFLAGLSRNQVYYACCPNVLPLTNPPVLKLWDTQGYLWLPYDLAEIKLIGETFEPKIFFSKKGFCNIVIPSGVLIFLPY